MKKTFIKILGIIFLIMIICQQVANASSIQIPSISPEMETKMKFESTIFAIIQLLIGISTLIYMIFGVLLLAIIIIESIKGEKKEHRAIENAIVIAVILYLLAICIRLFLLEDVVTAVIVALIIIVAIVSRIINNKILSKVINFLFIYIPLVLLLYALIELIIFNVLIR